MVHAIIVTSQTHRTVPPRKFSTDSDMTQKLLVAFLQTTGQAEKAYKITHEIPDDEEEDEDFTGFAD